ncbi:MAG: hypothetical protein HN742_41520 [Lentisphaerae bacterium]|jgi:hypothetical protein|nr:hypothetical protein [Lentisphaerota bacterium]MBT4816974.1 hypothetical protein [Lentisphaerota bacterium]MBT5611746.1 hypothetical protein [Lentisphaerota bacterium]MBT7054148.1 hypothetical protein [Lentisphaerota bacterium]MBT7848417.1 hypothetical protein [Lentisphaerota bacterium]
MLTSTFAFGTRSFFGGAVLAAGLSVLSPLHAAERPGPIVSTTIDFLDYCFFKTDAETGYFTEQQYDDVIRAVAEAGFAKIYLRVDVCGVTLYPTTVGKRYAGDGRDPGSTYLVNTLQRYDPAAKTIELGHKYGMEVWAWDTLFDDEATMVWYGDADDDRQERFGEYPLKDPFLVRNPQFQWELDPRIAAQQKAAVAASDRDAPITAIRLTSDTTSRQNRVTAEMFDIFVSNDNRRYRKYEGPRNFHVVTAKPAVLLLDNLQIAESYIKLAFHKPWPRENTFTISSEPDAFVQLRYGGAWHAAPSDYRKQPEGAEKGGFDFVATRFAWDFGNRALGIGKFVPQLPRYYGIAEIAHPEVRAHKLAKLRELAAYPFDGFAYSIRTHTLGCGPQHYGYNPVTCEAFKKRNGVDIRTQEFDRDAWLNLRAAAVNAYLVEAGKLLKPRPLYMDFPRQEAKAPYIRAYGGMPFQAGAWARDGAVAGVRMLGFSGKEPITPPFEGADRVRIIRFVDNWKMPPPEEFRANLRRWLANPVLHEIEFYETLIYTLKPDYLTIFREEIARQGGAAPPPKR